MGAWGWEEKGRHKGKRKGEEEGEKNLREQIIK